MSKNKDNIQLVKTDYDNFKDMAFFIHQQKKANEMLREVHDFQKSFILSKFISFREFVEQNPGYGLKLFNSPCLTYYEKSHTKDIHDYPGQSDSKDIISYGYLHIFPDLPVIYRRTKYLPHNYSHYVYWRGMKEENVKAMNMSSAEEEILDDFYFSMYTLFDMPHASDTERQLRYCVHTFSSGCKYHERPEDKTNIITDWRPYIKLDSLNGYMYSHNPYDVTGNWRFIHCKECSFMFKSKEAIEECYNIIRNRFKDAIEIYTRLYKNDFEGRMERLWDKGYISPDDKNFIVWEGQPKFISICPDKYEAEISLDESSISFKFELAQTIDRRERMFPGPYGFAPRACKLTYSTKNNELINYQEYL